jgi:hypothetical protein
MKKKLSTIFRLLLGVLILAILIYKVGVKEIYETLISINLSFLFVVIVVNFIPFFIATLNLKLLIDGIKKISFFKLLKYYILSWSVGLFVPGRLGEFSLIYFLRKEDIDIGKGTVVAVIDKLITAVTLSFLTIAAFFVFFTAAEVVKLVGFLFVGFLLFLFFIVTEMGRGLIKKFILRKFADKFKGFSETFFFYFKKKKKVLLINFFLTFIKWVLNAVIISILFLAFGVSIDFYYVLLVTSTTIIISLIPISISGLGVKESAAVLLFGQIGVSASVVVSVFLIFTVISYIFAAFIFSFVKLDKKKIEELNLAASDAARE